MFSACSESRLDAAKNHAKATTKAFKEKVGTKNAPAPLHELSDTQEPEYYIERGAKVADNILERKIEGKSIRERLQSTDVTTRFTAAKTLHEIIQKELSKVRPTAKAAAVNGSAKAKAVIRRASTRLPDDWTVESDNLGALSARYTESGRGFAYTSDAKGRVRLPSFGVVDAEVGDGYILTRQLSTAEHEFLHRIQSAIPELDQVFRNVHKRRTKGDPLERMRDLTGLNYRASEVTRKDGYYNPYMGREYPNQGPMELLTMALEPIIGEQSDELALRLRDLINIDEEMFKLALGLLFHYKR